MAYNPVSAARLPPDDPFFTAEGTLAEPEVSQSHRLHKTHGSAYAGGYAHNTFGEGSDRQAQYADRPSHMTGYALSSATGNYFPQMISSPGWGHVSQSIAASQFPQMYDDQQSWGIGASSPRGGSLTQMPTRQRESSLVNLSSPREQVHASQPNSVKHLTCWYWANKGCKLPEHVCLYSHSDTGRLAEPPVKVQRGRPAVAGKNATNPQPVFKDWRGHQRAQSGFVGPQTLQIQRQIERIHAKAAQRPNPIPVMAEQPESANTVTDDFGFAEPAASFNRPQPNDHLSSPPADSYRNLSSGIGAFGQPFHQQLSYPSQQTGGNFMDLGPTAHHTGASSYQGAGGHYGNDGVMGGGYGGLGNNITNYGPSPHQIGSNNPSNLNASAPSEYGQPGYYFREMHKKMKVKDKVITELAGIIEMLEINYGISIDDQHETLEKLMGIAQSLEEEARKGGTAMSAGEGMGRASHAPALSISNRQYGKLPAHHERLMDAMKASTNLVQMEKMTLRNSKARKVAVGGQLESIKAVKLLPRGWMER